MNLIEISERFSNEIDVLEYFEKERWPVAANCPYCKSYSISDRRKDLRFYCDNCKKGFSVTVNTHLHNTRLSLKTWLYAFAIVTDAKKGLSAMQLQRNLGVHYETAWTMYHKIRELMTLDNKEIDELDNIVEMDETFVGGKPRKFNTGDSVAPTHKTKIPELDERIVELKEEGISFKRKKGNPAKSLENPKRGRGANKIPVVGIVERDGNVVAQVMKDLTYKNLSDMVKKHVEEDDAVLITDEYPGYNRMEKIIEHVKIDHQKLYSYRGVNTNTIESFWAFIKRQIMGQHHHVSPKYLPNYVAETVFKFNNRQEDDMFETLVKNSMRKK